MRKRLGTVILMMLLLGITSVTYATSFWQAYQDALRNDPAYRVAKAEYQAEREAIAQARAPLFPQLSFNTNLSQQSNGGNNFGARNYQLNASQIIFDWSAFKDLSEAKAKVKAAKARLIAAKEDLILRFGEAYFAVLSAYDILQFTREQRDALKAQVAAVKEQYKLHYATITALNQAKAAYDLARSRFYTARITLIEKIQSLVQITAKHYRALSNLKDRFPLIKFRHNQLSSFVRQSIMNNWNLVAARYDLVAAHQALSGSYGGLFPAISAVAEYNNGNGDTVTTTTRRRRDSLSYGLSLQYDTLQGGLAISDIRTARAQLHKAQAEVMRAYLEGVTQTQQAYNSIRIGASQIISGRLAVRSNKKALQQTKESYIAGTETVLDVVDQQNKLFDAQQKYTEDRFAYLNNFFQLSQGMGKLNENTVRKINRWMQQRASLPSPRQTRGARVQQYQNTPLKKISISLRHEVGKLSRIKTKKRIAKQDSKSFAKKHFKVVNKKHHQLADKIKSKGMASIKLSSQQKKLPTPNITEKTLMLPAPIAIVEPPELKHRS